MAKAGIQLDLLGDKRLQRALVKLGKESRQRTVIRKSLNAATTPMNKAIKARAPKRSGVYKKSIGKRSVTYKGAGSVVVFIGARRGFKTINPNGTPHDPARISHLLEFGHGGPRAARAYPHFRPGYDATVSQAQKIFNEKAWENIRKEARRVAAKGTR